MDSQPTSDMPDATKTPITNENEVPGGSPTNSNMPVATIPPPIKISQTQPPKKSKLPLIVIILSFIFWPILILLVCLFAYLAYEARHGVSGTEYIAMLVAPVILVEFVLGIIYLITLVVYIFSKGPNRSKKILSAAAAAIILAIYGWQIIGGIQQVHQVAQSKRPMSDQQAMQLIDSCQVESLQKNGNLVKLQLVSSAYSDTKGNWLWRSTTANAKNWDKFVDEVKKVKSKCGGSADAFDINSGPQTSWISVDQATKLLQDCKIKTFNYTPSGLQDLTKPSTGKPTGIILEQYPTFAHLFIEPGEESAMIKVARSVQPKCDGPQFYHDGHYEQKVNGIWQ